MGSEMCIRDRYCCDKAALALLYSRLEKQKTERGIAASAIWLYGMAIQIAQQRSSRLGKDATLATVSALQGEIRVIVMLVLLGRYTPDQAMALLCAPAYKVRQQVMEALTSPRKNATGCCVTNAAAPALAPPF